RLRERWLLITMRLSISSLAGIARRLVAVGTWRLDSMLVTVRAVAPRSRVTWDSDWGLVTARAGASRGVGGWSEALALSSAVFCGLSSSSAGFGSAGFCSEDFCSEDFCSEDFCFGAAALGSAFFSAALGSAFFSAC